MSRVLILATIALAATVELTIGGVKSILAVGVPIEPTESELGALDGAGIVYEVSGYADASEGEAHEPLTTDELAAALALPAPLEQPEPVVDAGDPASAPPAAPVEPAPTPDAPAE